MNEKEITIKLNNCVTYCKKKEDIRIELRIRIYKTFQQGHLHLSSILYIGNIIQ
jgi:hypothetical protein